MPQLLKSPSTNTARSIDRSVVTLGVTLGCSCIVWAKNVYKNDRHLAEFTGRSCADAFSYAEIGGPFDVHHYTQPSIHIRQFMRLVTCVVH